MITETIIIIIIAYIHRLYIQEKICIMEYDGDLRACVCMVFFLIHFFVLWNCILYVLSSLYQNCG